jgi:hypothetical protein
MRRERGAKSPADWMIVSTLAAGPSGLNAVSERRDKEWGQKRYAPMRGHSGT